MKKKLLLVSIGLMSIAGSKQCQSQSWSLTGNAGTSASTNFVGTTDNVALKFRTNNLTRLTISSGGNVGIGTGSPSNKLSVNGSGNFTGNLGIGTSSPGYKLQVIGTGRFEDGIKMGGFGIVELDAPGIVAGRLKIDSAGNLGIGVVHPLYKLDVKGDANINGIKVGRGNNNDSSNTVVGYNSLTSNTTGIENVACGYNTLNFNLTGGLNTAMGYQTLMFNTDGHHNVGTGFSALWVNNSGSFNTATGANALGNNLTGTGNTANGYFTLVTNTSGNNNTGIGNLANVSSDALSNATALGYQANVDASDKVRIGNSSVSSYSCQVNWTAGSDARIKDNVQENIHGLDFINALRPVTFHYNVDKQNKLMGINNDEPWKSKKDIEKIAFSGFLAQEVDDAAQMVGYDFSGVDKSGVVMGLRYSEFTVPLVKGMQELSKQNEKLISDNAELKRENKEIRTRIDGIEKSLSQCCSNFVPSDVKQTIVNSTDAARLEQNQPNPFNHLSVIKFYVPSTCHTAQLVITDLSGVVLKSISINHSGAEQVAIDANEFVPGSYLYSLIVDGTKVESRQMELLK